MWHYSFSITTRGDLMKVILLLVSLMFAATAYGQEAVMFGEIAIGKPISIPACAPGYEVTHHPLCYTGGRKSSVFLEFDQFEAPAFVGNVPPLLYLKEGVVVGMDIFTNGVIGQAEAFDSLQRKFGRPASSITSKVETVRGVKHDSISAKWKIGDVSVEFSGTTGNATDGMITIGTPDLNDVRKVPERRKM
jgi:hypothetical protein